MESKIVEALKDKTEEFFISDSERVMLCEMLACVATVLASGRLWFNAPGDPVNGCYESLAREVSKRLANMPVHNEQ